MSPHAHQARVSWTGSTGLGYREYSRSHDATAPPAGTGLRLSADPLFRGDGGLMNPEQLLVLAASSCQLLSFLALAARRHVDVVDYRDDACGWMSDDGPARIGRIALRPVITVRSGTDRDAVGRLVEDAHHECYIANSLVTEVEVTATIEEAAP